MKPDGADLAQLSSALGTHEPISCPERHLILISLKILGLFSLVSADLSLPLSFPQHILLLCDKISVFPHKLSDKCFPDGPAVVTHLLVLSNHPGDLWCHPPWCGTKNLWVPCATTTRETMNSLVTPAWLQGRGWRTRTAQQTA